MAERRAPYAPEYRRQMVELVRAGRAVVRPAAGPLRLDALADRIEAHVRATARGGA